MQIAVIGAGISGMSAAWLLSGRHEVVLFEREPRFGGHSNTLEVKEPVRSVAVDTGFIVYNTACYPNLMALFDHLGVETSPTDMSFAVSLSGGGYEYNGNGLNGYFAQRSNVFSLEHWRMAGEIKRFFKEANLLQAEAADPSLTLGHWLAARNYSRIFIERHIVPMGAAIWSAPASVMLGFPAQSFASFFANHGLLQLNGRPQWRTVRGGSREYVSRLMADFKGRATKGDGVVGVKRAADGVTVRTHSGEERKFDRCLIACHADEALGLLSDASSDERRLLGAFNYAANDAVLHSDASHMPTRRRAWASWNYLGGLTPGADGGAAVTYWMNKLQPLPTSTDYFVSLNPLTPVAADKIFARERYHHPLFDVAALVAQKTLWSLQGARNTWFAGSYFGYGFHEDALQSGLAAAEDAGSVDGVSTVRRPWRVTGESSRLMFCARSHRIDAEAQVAAQ